MTTTDNNSVVPSSLSPQPPSSSSPVITNNADKHQEHVTPPRSPTTTSTTTNPNHQHHQQQHLIAQQLAARQSHLSTASSIINRISTHLHEVQQGRTAAEVLQVQHDHQQQRLQQQQLQRKRLSAQSSGGGVEIIRNSNNNYNASDAAPPTDASTRTQKGPSDDPQSPPRSEGEAAKALIHNQQQVQQQQQQHLKNTGVTSGQISNSGSALYLPKTSLFTALPHVQSKLYGNRGQYFQLLKLGEGACGAAYLVEWRPGLTAADKELAREARARVATPESRSMRVAATVADKNASSPVVFRPLQQRQRGGGESSGGGPLDSTRILGGNNDDDDDHNDTSSSEFANSHNTTNNSNNSRGAVVTLANVAQQHQQRTPPSVPTVINNSFFAPPPVTSNSMHNIKSTSRAVLVGQQSSFSSMPVQRATLTTSPSKRPRAATHTNTSPGASPLSNNGIILGSSPTVASSSNNNSRVILVSGISSNLLLATPSNLTATSEAANNSAANNRDSPPSPSEIALQPPARVSSLSCCKSTLEVHSGEPGTAPRRVSSDRVFVLKMEQKKVEEVAVEEHSALIDPTGALERLRTSAVVSRIPSSIGSSVSLVNGKVAINSNNGIVVVTPRAHSLHLPGEENDDDDGDDAENRNRRQLHSSSNVSSRASSVHNNLRHSPSSLATTSSPESRSVSISNLQQSQQSQQQQDTAQSPNQQQHQQYYHHRRFRDDYVRELLAARLRPKETEILSKCAHPNIVAFIDSFEDKTHRYTVMEYVDGGDLREEVTRRLNHHRGMRFLSQGSALFLFVQVVLAVEYLHRHGILHKDIKTANVLCSKKWMCKLADLGFAAEFEKETTIGQQQRDATDFNVNKAQGTPHSMAPELFLREPVSDKTDVWALGCVLYELLELRRPFQRGPGFDSVEQVAKRIVREPHNPVSRGNVTFDVLQLLDKMLSKEPEDRPTTKEILRTPVMSLALDDYVSKFTGAARESSSPTDAAWIAVLEEHVQLIRSDELPSAMSRHEERVKRRVATATRQLRGGVSSPQTPESNAMPALRSRSPAQQRALLFREK